MRNRFVPDEGGSVPRFPGMASPAGEGAMSAGEREFGIPVVVEFLRLPSRRRVAAVAACRYRRLVGFFR
jgi:hypothetical protein